MPTRDTHLHLSRRKRPGGKDTWENEKLLLLAAPNTEGVDAPNSPGLLEAWLKEKPVEGALCPKLKPEPEAGAPKGWGVALPPKRLDEELWGWPKAGVDPRLVPKPAHDGYNQGDGMQNSEQRLC